MNTTSNNSSSNTSTSTTVPSNGIQQGGMPTINFEDMIHLSPKTMNTLNTINNVILYILIIAIIFFITFFSSNIETTYPDQFHSITQEPLYKIIILFIIILVSEVSVPLAILLAIAYLLMIYDVNLLSKINETFANKFY